MPDYMPDNDYLCQCPHCVARRNARSTVRPVGRSGSDDLVMVGECDYCGDERPENELIDANDSSGRYCDSCVAYCDDCGDWWLDLGSHQDAHCDNCGYMCGYRDIFRCYDCDAERCEDCGSCSCDDDDDDSSGVLPYSYRPSPYLPKGDYSAPSFLLGIECEVAGRQSEIVAAVRAVDPMCQNLYVKRDASLSSGAEIVTHPMTLDYAQSFPFAAMLRDLDSRGCYTASGYGIHVHVSRRAFPKASHAMRWLMFLYANESQIINYVAHRDDEQWASWASPRRGELRRKAVGPYGSDRYVAVNCNNERTYELRVFQATLDPQRFYASVEFCDASVHYVRSMSCSEFIHGGISWDSFIAWLVANDETAGRYPNLIAECGEH